MFRKLPFLQALGTAVIEALFPLSPAERLLASYTPEQASEALLQAPRPPHSDMDAVFAYADEQAARLVWNIKYRKSPHALAIGSHALAKKAIDIAIATDSEAMAGSGAAAKTSRIILVPLPMSARRRRERGFNQCELLVDGMIAEIARTADGRTSDGRAPDRHFSRADLLKRTRHRERQTLKDRAARLKDAAGIFAVDASLIDQARADQPLIIVVDDVITTGSTLREALDTLRTAGCTRVRGLALAH